MFWTYQWRYVDESAWRTCAWRWDSIEVAASRAGYWLGVCEENDAPIEVRLTKAG